MWLDALCTNVDRTARNPNLLLWHERLWLIDHGAALYLQHGGLDPAAHATRPFPLIADHVLLARAGSIVEADARMRARIGDGAVAGAPSHWCPDEWFAGADAADVYVEYLLGAAGRRCAFVEEAERARAGR